MVNVILFLARMYRVMGIRRFIVLLLLLSACGGRTDSTAPDTEAAMVTASASSEVGNINLEKSVIYWKGTKFSNTRYHEGFLKLKAGNLRVENGIIKGGSFLVDINTIQVTDIPEHEAKARANLEMHLKRDFDADQFPYSQFCITGVVQVGNSQQICGDLQIRDIKRKVCFKTTTQGKLHLASLTLNRSEWNIGAEGSWLEERLVDDAFYLTIKLWVI